MTKTIQVSAFRWVPPAAQGLVRDLRVRWALEEAGLPYQMRLIGPEDQKSASYRALQPFGQVPTYEEDDLTLFESGAIVLHIAEQSEVLMPSDPTARARVKTWMFAALNSVEPFIQMLFFADNQKSGREVDLVKSKLEALSVSLGSRDYLVQRFTAADLLMSTVLRILHRTDLLAQVPALEAYRSRCEARPGFQKALADQLATFAAHAPAG